MSVIAEVLVAADQFELGRLLTSNGTPELSLESVVPLGRAAVPFVRVGGGKGTFQETVAAHPSVESVREVDSEGETALYAIDWRVDRDLLLEGLQESGGQLLEATASEGVWRFQFRFPGHEALSNFEDYCDSAHLEVTVERIYNPTTPRAGAWYGVTGPQRETLMRAVEAGYYDIPRRISTAELAEEFGISDQAVTERLRRGIAALVVNTLLTFEEFEA